MSGDIEKFLAAKAFAVVGASKNRDKFGNKVLRCYLQNKRRVYPVHAQEASIEGQPCVKELSALPLDVTSLSVITPPAVTTQILAQIKGSAITDVWMQPGAESPEAIALCKAAGINVITGGPCLLVVLSYNPA